MVQYSDKCECFACSIPCLDTFKIIRHNGVFQSQGKNGFEDIDGKIEITEDKDNHFILRVKENAVIQRPVQIINLFDGKTNASHEERLEIIAQKNSKVTFLYCDDVVLGKETEVVHHINIEADDFSDVSFYKLENVNNSTSLSSDITFNLNGDVNLRTFFISLNGAKLVNNINVNFIKEHSSADINGLYLMDNTQSVENIVTVRHNSNSCMSNQLFKGILDDHAKAKFVGHVFVDYNAKGNDARQINNNILLTDKAHIDTRPFLEIYNDDIKCSHGATTGRLDEGALFYLKTRGISQKRAKMLLLNAFCQGIMLKSDINELREGLSSMIQKRLDGELNMNDALTGKIVF